MIDEAHCISEWGHDFRPAYLSLGVARQSLSFVAHGREAHRVGRALSRLSEEKVEKDKEKLERMMQYGQSAMCRWRLLHDYFGEAMEEARCGTCDNCMHPLEEQMLATHRPSTVTQINGHT